ncbi:hypothetical protein SAMN05216488_2300 [Microbacterium sp. LKL04]|nr:hypothetical protein SAMN05216488_2300 [Microbacterium sp. LKL04]
MRAPYLVMFVGSLLTFLGGTALAIFAIASDLPGPPAGIGLAVLGALGTIIGGQQLRKGRGKGAPSDDS